MLLHYGIKVISRVPRFISAGDASVTPGELAGDDARATLSTALA
jgi:hypothetical protein